MAAKTRTTDHPAHHPQPFREALTFDDVLLTPGLSDLLPADADIRTRITREISLNIPIVASAMATSPSSAMAIVGFDACVRETNAFK